LGVDSVLDEDVSAELLSQTPNSRRVLISLHVDAEPCEELCEAQRQALGVKKNCSLLALRVPDEQ
jgi:hypothetical protein